MPQKKPLGKAMGDQASGLMFTPEGDHNQVVLTPILSEVYAVGGSGSRALVP